MILTPIVWVCILGAADGLDGARESMKRAYWRKHDAEKTPLDHHRRLSR
jgi:hypothetical protein